MNRWDLLVDFDGNAEMMQFDDGEYVRYEDVEKMMDALKEIKHAASCKNAELGYIKELAEEGLL